MITFKNFPGGIEFITWQTDKFEYMFNFIFDL